VRRGHIITVLWAVYFAALLIMRLFLTFDNIYVMCGMASLGLVFYRINKATRYDSNGAERQKTGYTIFWVVLVIFAFLAIAALLVSVRRVWESFESVTGCWNMCLIRLDVR
jgi:uncharacterized membrane protein